MISSIKYIIKKCLFSEDKFKKAVMNHLADIKDRGGFFKPDYGIQKYIYSDLIAVSELYQLYQKIKKEEDEMNNIFHTDEIMSIYATTEENIKNLGDIIKEAGVQTLENMRSVFGRMTYRVPEKTPGGKYVGLDEVEEKEEAACSTDTKE